MFVCRLEPESPKNDKIVGHHGAKHFKPHVYENSDKFIQNILSDCNQRVATGFESRNGVLDYEISGIRNKKYGITQKADNISYKRRPVSLEEISEAQNDESFVKYIPVKEEYGWVYPRYLVDEQSPTSWFDIQCWYQQYRSHKAVQSPHLSPMSTHNTADASCEDSVVNPDLWNTGDVMVEGKFYAITDDLADDPRFGLAANQDYLKLLLERKSSIMWLCHMQFFFCDNSKSHLFQIKSELLVSCIQAFVQKDADFEVLWVDDIKKILPDKDGIDRFFDESEKLTSIIEKQVETAKAVLYVTEKASILLRHSDTCFLSSLAMSAGLDRSELAVLPLDIKPHPAS